MSAYPRSDGSRPDRVDGQQFVAIDFLCSSCQRINVRSRMARVGLDVGEASTADPWVRAWRKDGVQYRPKWTKDDRSMLLICVRCGHAPDPVLREWIEVMLAGLIEESGGNPRVVSVCL